MNTRIAGTDRTGAEKLVSMLVHSRLKGFDFRAFRKLDRYKMPSWKKNNPLSDFKTSEIRHAMNSILDDYLHGARAVGLESLSINTKNKNSTYSRTVTGKFLLEGS